MTRIYRLRPALKPAQAPDSLGLVLALVRAIEARSEAARACWALVARLEADLHDR